MIRAARESVLMFLLACLVGCVGAPRGPEERHGVWQSGEITLGGVRIHYWDSAPQGADTTLLCIHGWGGTAIDYSVLPRYLPAGVRVIAPDLPGSGRSGPAPDHNYTMDLFTDVVDEMVRLFPVTGLVAHSLGGKVALTWMSRHPDRFDRLILLSPFGMAGEEGNFYGWASGKPRLVRLAFLLNNRWAIRRAARKNVFFDPSRMDGPTAAASEASQLSSDGRRAMTSVTVNMIGPDPIDDLLPGITAAVLLIWGRDDPFLKASWAAAFAEKLPDATLELLPECGHLPMVEKPRETVAAILSFLP